MYVLRMRPSDAGPGLTDEVRESDNKEDLVKFYNEERVAPWYENSNGRKILRHFKPGSELIDYEPINVDHVDSNGAGIVEDNTRRPMTDVELKQLAKEIAAAPHTHPTLVHRLVATIQEGVIDT